MNSARSAPFYCGSQRMDWKCYNCDRCTKRYDEANRDWRCDLERKIDEAYMGDGTVDAETARRMGEPEDCRVHNWRCPEFVKDPEVEEMVRRLAEAQRAYQNRHRPAPWMEDWLAKRVPNPKP